MSTNIKQRLSAVLFDPVMGSVHQNRAPPPTVA